MAEPTDKEKNRLPGMKALYQLYDAMTDTNDRIGRGLEQGAQSAVRGLNAAGEKAADLIDGGKYDFSKKDTLAQAAELVKRGMRGKDYYDHEKNDISQNTNVAREDYNTKRANEAQRQTLQQKQASQGIFIKPTDVTGKSRSKPYQEDGETWGHPGPPNGFRKIGTDKHGLEIYQGGSTYHAYTPQGEHIHETTDISDFDFEGGTPGQTDTRRPMPSRRKK